MTTPAPRRRRGRRFWILVGLGVVVAACVVFNAVFGRYVIRSDSMEPALRPGDHILVYRYSAAPSRGDIVTVHPRGLGDEIIKGAATESSLLFVERVVGLPGETVMIRRNQVEICRAPGIGCHRLRERYRFVGDLMGNYGPATDPPGDYFLMGDYAAWPRTRACGGRRRGTTSSAPWSRWTGRLAASRSCDGSGRSRRRERMLLA